MRGILGNQILRNLNISEILPTFYKTSRVSFYKNNNGTFYDWLLWLPQKRWMTKHRRVQDRSKKKRVHDLETATERWKVTSKVLFIMELLRKEEEQIIPLRRLEQYRQHINISKPYKVSDFVKKSPKLFDLYKDRKGVVWCGLTEKAETLVEVEKKLLEDHTDKVVEYVTRLLMMSIEKRLPLDKIAHFRRDIGLPFDFRTKWVHMFPDNFRVIKIEDNEYLELTSWNSSWAVTEIEKKAIGGVTNYDSHTPGLITHPFPMKFPPRFKKLVDEKIQNFQKRPYLSPYADARELSPGSQEFDKRAIAIMHEILNFTIEKRLVTDHLTHFRREFLMPQKLMRLLLKHYGIFYVSERGKRFSVFLNEAYEGSELIDKCPLYVWKEKILSLTGYRGRRNRIERYFDHSDSEDIIFGEDDESSNKNILRVEDSGEDSEMDVGELLGAYEGS